MMPAATPHPTAPPALTGTKGGSGVWQRIISEIPPVEVMIEPFWGRGTISRKMRRPAHLIGVDRDPDAISAGVDVGALMFEGCGIAWMKSYFRLHSLWEQGVEGSNPSGPTPDASTSAAASTSGGPVRSSDARSGGGRPPPEMSAAAAAATSGGAGPSRSTAARSGDNGSGGGVLLGNKSEIRNPKSEMALPGTATTFGGASWSRHFCYIDPPYLGCSGYYKHELSAEQHADLCRVFLALPCPAAISGYHTELYADMLAGCRLVKIPTVNRAGRRVTEHLWCNYAPPQRLHDPRYIGAGRRGREVIRKRVDRWVAGLMRRPPLERQAVIEALVAECGDLVPTTDVEAVPGSAISDF